MTARETFHIEILDPEEEGGVRQRVSVRVFGLENAKERALRMFARASVAGRATAPAEAVRVIDGAGAEVFSWSRFDDGR